MTFSVPVLYIEALLVFLKNLYHGKFFVNLSKILCNLYKCQLTLLFVLNLVNK